MKSVLFSISNILKHSAVVFQKSRPVRFLKYTVIVLFILVSFNSCLDSGPGDDGLQEEVDAIDQYISTFGNPSGYLIKTNTGIRVVVNYLGLQSGPPTQSQTVTVDYIGRLMSSGVQFDNGTITDKTTNTITPQGLGYALTGLTKGASATIYIPSRYGFGSAGTSTVPPNSILIYDVFVDDIKRTTAQQQQFTVDTTAIRTYIEENELEAEQHISGIWYNASTDNIGDAPTPYDMVDIKYKVSNMANGTLYDEGTLTGYYVLDLIEGLIVGLPLLEAGNTATYYIPSTMAYGPNGSASIPGNANLIFEIELLKVYPQQ